MVVFVIPSLSRVKTLATKSLNLLVDRYNVPCSSIFIFVIREEFEAYTSLYALYPKIRIVVGPLGLHNMRNHIRLYFPVSTQMVCLDDDIDDLCIMRVDESIIDKTKASRYPLVSMSSTEFGAFINDAFETLRATNLRLFGIYPVRNGYFMKGLPYKSIDLRFCVGAFWGCINDHSTDLVIHIEEKEDFERTLLYYKKDRGVLRFNTICPKTKYYKEAGGMQSTSIDRTESSKVSCAYLIDRFPEYCKLYTSKKSGIYEVRLITRHAF